MEPAFNRRNFLKGGSVAVAAASGAGLAAGLAAPGLAQAAGQAPFASAGRAADLPKAKGPRLVVVGGGTSGLTIAKYAKKEYPDFDVVLVERRDMYSSCFTSNLWYADIINLEYLANHSFLDAAVNNGYVYFQATALGLDRAGRTLVTDQGDIQYDFLVVAPGISYDWSKIGVDDVEAQTALRLNYPGGFIAPTEHVTIRRKIREFEGGTFVQTVPSGNYRCLPAPYERACMMASVIKKNKIKGKVIVLDANPEITIKAEGFHAAFDELYKDIIEWHPDSAVTGVDVGGKVIKTEFDDIAFDDAIIYPNVRASTLIEQFGLEAPSTRSNQHEADIDIRFYNFKDDERVYVTGDARRHPYSKSANTSNTEAHYVAKVLAARAQDKAIEWTSPQTLCYSMVAADPQEAIYVDTYYGYDKAQDAITGFADTQLFQSRNEDNAAAYLEWGKGLYRDMFKA